MLGDRPYPVFFSGPHQSTTLMGKAKAEPQPRSSPLPKRNRAAKSRLQSTRTRGSGASAPSISSVIAHTIASARSGERPGP